MEKKKAGGPSNGQASKNGQDAKSELKKGRASAETGAHPPALEESRRGAAGKAPPRAKASRRFQGKVPDPRAPGAKAGDPAPALASKKGASNGETPIRTHGLSRWPLLLPLSERQARAVLARKLLDRIFPNPPIPLYHTDPFTLLCAVALSAHTTDKSVNQVTPALFAEAGRPEAMAALSPEAIYSRIRTVGLARTKSKALWRLSQILVEKHGGQVPPRFEDLEALPGVGHKTASVVMSQAFGVPAFPVDTHIHRLATRWRLTNGRSVEFTERDLKEVFDEKHWNRLHLQLIYYGREYCPARHHDSARCPICRELDIHFPETQKS